LSCFSAANFRFLFSGDKLNYNTTLAVYAAKAGTIFYISFVYMLCGAGHTHMQDDWLTLWNKSKLKKYWF